MLNSVRNYFEKSYMSLNVFFSFYYQLVLVQIKLYSLKIKKEKSGYLDLT